VNFSRVQWALEAESGSYRKVEGRKENNWVWSPQHVVNMHRPETWGYVQFSRAGAGAARFTPDPSLPARRWLHKVYYAQKDYRHANGRWAGTLEQLGISAPEAALTSPRLQVTDNLFEASIDLRLPDGKTQRWNIRQDALVFESRTASR
jgi:hypothetical protein